MEQALKAAIVPGLLAFVAISAVSLVNIQSRAGQVIAGALAGVVAVAAATQLK
jgi:hypothetical protein